MPDPSARDGEAVLADQPAVPALWDLAERHVGRNALLWCSLRL